MTTYPHPDKAVPYDSTVWARKETSETARLQGLSSGARGRCSNHAQFPAVVMQKHGKIYHAYCAHCVDVGNRIHADILERLAKEAAMPKRGVSGTDRRTAVNAHVFRRTDAVG